MEIKITEQEVKTEYPELYSSVIEKMTKKGVDVTKLEWCYSYCISFDNSPEPTSLQESLNDAKRKYGISLVAKSGRKHSDVLIKRAGDSSELPKIFIKMATDDWNYMDKENKKEQNMISNLDSILKTVGKKGTSKNNNNIFRIGNGIDFMNHMANYQKPIYPTIEDIKNIKPEIYQKYLNDADGTKLVIYSPGHEDCDEWGFFYEPIKLATRRNNEDRFITSDDDCYTIDKNEVNFSGGLNGLDKAIAAKEGDFFKGWKNTKQYRLTQSEISKIFSVGDLKF